jgi:ABC-type amino acid transport system permease subunit
MNDLKAADYIAIIVILGYFFLAYVGTSFELPPAFLLVIGYYFGHSASLNGSVRAGIQKDKEDTIQKIIDETN